MQTPTLIPSRRTRLKRAVSLFVLGCLLLALSVLSVPAGAATTAEQEEAQRKALTGKGIDEVRKIFTATGDPLDPDKRKEEDRDFNVHEAGGLSGKVVNGYEPRDNTPSWIKDFKDNPWLEWSNKDGDVNEAHSIPKGSGLPVRFVLTDIVTRHGGGTVAGKADGVVYVFRQEYNTNIAVILWSRDGSLFNAGEDLDRFVYASSCYQTTSEDENVWMAKAHPQDADDRHGDFPDDPSDEEKMKAVQDKYKVKKCDVNTGVFAGMIKKAQQAIKEGIETVFEQIKSWLLSVIDVGSLNDNRGLTQAWMTIRDLVNLAFILILIVIAFSNILRFNIEAYGTRALLPRLIFAIIAVNFSLTMVQIMVNAAYILSQPFLNVSLDLLASPPAGAGIINAEGNFGEFLLAILVVGLVLLGFLVLLFVFLVRIIFIWLLAALSPFVFLFMVLPVTRSLASMWWKNAIKWIFMAPISFIILYIAASLVNNQRDSDIHGPDFILKLAFFVGAAFAAVMIPLKIGGEIMGMAAKGAKGGGKFGGKAAIGAAVSGSKNPAKWNRSGDAYLKRRKASQEEEAGLQAARAQAGVSQRLSSMGPMGRGAASLLTGARADTVDAQQASMIDKYANDINKNGKYDKPVQKLIARGKTKELEDMGLQGAARMSERKEGRQAAGRLLAQQGFLNQRFLWNHDGDDGEDPGLTPAQRAEQLEAGNHSFMRNVDPGLAALGVDGKTSKTSLEMAHAQTRATDSQQARHWKYEDLRRGFKAGGEREKAARAQMRGMQGRTVSKMLDENDTLSFIGEDSEREALVEMAETALDKGIVKDDAQGTMREAIKNYKQYGTSKPRLGGGTGGSGGGGGGGGGGRPTPRPRPRPSGSGGRGRTLDNASPEDFG